MDFDEVFVCCWGGGGQVGYFEVEGALYLAISECTGDSCDRMRVYLDIFAELDGAHCVFLLAGNNNIVVNQFVESLLEVVVDKEVDSGDSFDRSWGCGEACSK